MLPGNSCGVEPDLLLHAALPNPAGLGLDPQHCRLELHAELGEVRQEPWEAFRDRHGDLGRDLGLCVGQRAWGLRLRELAEAVGLGDYAVASRAIQRFGRRLQSGGGQARDELWAIGQLLQVEM